jgi:hypothetical protein
MMVLRTVQALCYGAIIHEWLQLNGGGSITFCSALHSHRLQTTTHLLSTDCTAVPVIMCAEASIYFYVCTVIMFMLSTQLVETIVYVLPDIRTAYRLVPAVGFLLFYFSGIPVRPDLLPRWAAPWLPSVSMIRWLTQGLLINEYQYNRDAFPEVGPQQFSTYNYALSLFGWGGKTKWYCLYMLLINLAIYRALYLAVSIYHTTAQKGRRSQLQRE